MTPGQRATRSEMWRPYSRCAWATAPAASRNLCAEMVLCRWKGISTFKARTALDTTLPMCRQNANTVTTEGDIRVGDTAYAGRVISSGRISAHGGLYSGHTIYS